MFTALKLWLLIQDNEIVEQLGELAETHCAAVYYNIFQPNQKANKVHVRGVKKKTIFFAQEQKEQN